MTTREALGRWRLVSLSIQVLTKQLSETTTSRENMISSAPEFHFFLVIELMRGTLQVLLACLSGTISYLPFESLAHSSRWPFP